MAQMDPAGRLLYAIERCMELSDHGENWRGSRDHYSEAEFLRSERAARKYELFRPPFRFIPISK